MDNDTNRSSGTLGLGVDIGTTNIKVVLLESSHAEVEQPAIISSTSIPVQTVHHGAAVTQDGEQIWSGVVAGIQTVLHQAESFFNSNGRTDERYSGIALRDRVQTVGVCSQYSSIVPVDESAVPVGPVITYMDHRGEDECIDILSRHDDAFDLWLHRHGIPPVGAGLSLSHILYLQHHEPERHARTHAYLEVMEYITARLTGVIASTVPTTFATQLCNNTLHLNKAFSVNPNYDDDLVARSGVDPSKLPPLLPLGESPGTLSVEASHALGLQPDVVVASPMNDTHAGAYATGAFDDHRAGVMIGTTSVYIDTIDRVGTDIDHELVAMPAPEPHRYLVMAENGVAGRSVEHVLVNLLSPAPNNSKDMSDPFGEIDAAMQSSPPGANGLLFLPWIAGSMAPRVDGAMRGGFIGLSATHSRADMIRSLLEGTIHNLRWLIGPVEKLTGRTNQEVVFGGGAARLPVWAQVAADVLGRSVSVLEQPDFGAARAVGTVALARLNNTAPGPVPIAQRYAPRPEFASRYSELQQIFVNAFEATQPLMSQLHNNITNLGL